MPEPEVSAPKRRAHIAGSSTTARSALTRWRDVAVVEAVDDAVDEAAPETVADPAPQENADARSAARIAALQAQCRSAIQEAEDSKRLRATDAARMAERLSSLQEELAAVRTGAEFTRATLSKDRNRWRAVAFASGASAASVISIGALALLSGPAPSAAPAAMASPTPAIYQGSRELPRDPPAAFTSALDRLDSALDSVGDENPRDALWKVSRPGKECLMIWNQNSPAVLFGRKPIGANSLAGTLSDCADAVSRLTGPAPTR